MASAPRAAKTQRRTRIQGEKEAKILEAALDVFASFGFRGSTIDQIAVRAEMSKPNLLYYFRTKEAIHQSLLQNLLKTWLAPLREIQPEGEALDEIDRYLRRKLEISRRLPRESRLFANEMIQGAPHIRDTLEGPLKALVDEKAAIIQAWMEAGKLAPLDPYHLIFSIWATTQHYADFDVQICAVLGERTDGDQHFETALAFMRDLYLKALTPKARPL